MANEEEVGLVVVISYYSSGNFTNEILKENTTKET